MNNLAVVSTHFLLLLISCIFIRRILFSKHDRQTAVFNCAALITTLLNRTWNFSFEQSHFPRDKRYMPDKGEEFGISSYRCKLGSDEAVECAVCLYKIEEGDEIRELKCDHLFHKVCLDRWIGYRNGTCPMCRDFLVPRPKAAQIEVLSFESWLGSFSSSDHNRWWLR